MKGVLCSPAASDGSLLIVQLTDSHLPETADMQVSGVRPDGTLQRVIDTLSHRLPRHADLILATGDIADTGAAAAYARFLKYAEALPAPLYGLPGNHDNRAVFYHVWRDYAPQWIDTPDWRIILLDSTVPGRDEGRLGEHRLDELRTLLKDASGHVLVVVHHHPVPVRSPWLDEVMLEDAGALFECLQEYEQVKAVLCGHVHQAREGRYQGLDGDHASVASIRVMASPSTAFQFAPQTSDYQLDKAGPAYRWLLLHPDGTLDTTVEYLSVEDAGS